MKERLIEFLAYIGISQGAFEKKVGLSNGFVNNVGDSIRAKSLDKIVAAFPELNTAWLIVGEGDMLKGHTVQKIGSISGEVKGVVGTVHGDYHSNGGKDRAILEQEKNVQYSLDVLVSELQRFHDQLERKDAYLRELVDMGHKREAEHARRVDELVAVINKQQERALDLLVKTEKIKDFK